MLMNFFVSKFIALLNTFVYCRICSDLEYRVCNAYNMDC